MRDPAVAGRFYPSDPERLRAAIEDCFRSPLASSLPGDAGDSRAIRGAMVPHAGYMASGAVASDVYRRLKEDGRPDAYVIIGPDHHGMCDVNTICAEPFLTPFGPCPVHEDICGRLSKHVPNIPEAHAYEHSVEVEVPFLQYIDPDARIVPVMMSDQSPEAAVALAAALREACEGYDVVFLASTDMSHYIPKADAERLDDLVLDQVRRMDWMGMYRTVARNRITMCGYGPTAVMMMLCEGCRSDAVRHSDSFESIGLDPDSVVGYATAVMLRNRSGVSPGEGFRVARRPLQMRLRYLRFGS